MKQILSLLTLFVCTLPLTAQTPVRAAQRATRAIAIHPCATELGTLPHYNGARGALMGVNYAITRQVAHQTAHAALPPQVPPAVTPQRSWLEQQKRNWKAYRLQQQRHQAQFQALQAALAEQEYELAQAALPPLLEEQSFEVADFAAYVPPTGQQPKPAVPFAIRERRLAYRGLALAVDGAAIKNILENGLRIQDAGEENSTLRLAYASHGGYSAMRFLLENPVTNLTYGPKSAAAWGARRLSPDLPILTLVKVKGEFTGDSLETAVEDIPAGQIEELAVRLNLNGNLTWCRVRLNGNGTFTLTPYEPYYHLVK